MNPRYQLTSSVIRDAPNTCVSARSFMMAPADDGCNAFSAAHRSLEQLVDPAPGIGAKAVVAKDRDTKTPGW